MGAVLNPDIVTDGLVLCLDAGLPKSYPGSENIWYDISGSGNHGTLINGVGYVENNIGSLTFDGSNDYIQMPSPNNKFDWTPSGSGFNILAIEFWVKTNDTSGRCVSKPWNGNGEYNYTIDHNSWNCRIGAQSNVISFSSLATGNWEHIVCIVTPTQQAVYRNGLLNAGFTNHNITTNTPTYGSSNIPLAIMTLYPYGSGGWSYTSHAILGNLSNFKIFNRVLSPEDILKNYKALKGRYD